MRAIYIAYLVLKETLHRLVGLERDASVARTIFTLGFVLDALSPLSAPIRRALRPRRPPRPSAAGGLFAYGTGAHVVQSIGGEPLRGQPIAGVFIGAAVFAGLARFSRVPVRLARAAADAVLQAWRRVVEAAAAAAGQQT
jgi:hypothetical protein